MTSEGVENMETEASKQQKHERIDILLLQLYNKPVSPCLQDYFKRLEEGSPHWDIDHFIEGARRFADLHGPERATYYVDPLQGLNYPNSFIELWIRAYPQLSPTAQEEYFKLQCPPTWSSEAGTSWVLTYCGEAPLAQGLNELLRGLTTLDCGMYCQLLLWMAIRYLIGDKLFNEVFKSKNGRFTLTQGWHKPMDEDGTIGSLLNPFYDAPTLVHRLGSRIRTRTFYNHPEYFAKHPGGEGRLQNVTQIDDYYIIFDPSSPQILSPLKLEEKLIQAYNKPRDLADQRQILLYESFPNHTHYKFAKTFLTLAKEANDKTDHTLGESEWKSSQAEREEKARGLHLIFNLERLISCVEEQRLIEAIDEDIFSNAIKKKQRDVARWAKEAEEKLIRILEKYRISYKDE